MSTRVKKTAKRKEGQKGKRVNGGTILDAERAIAKYWGLTVQEAEETACLGSGKSRALPSADREFVRAVMVLADWAIRRRNLDRIARRKKKND